MKHEKWQTPLCTAFLALVISFGGMACLATGFSLTSDLRTVAACCTVTALLCALCFRMRLGLLPLCLGALLLGYLWRRGELDISMETMLFHMSDLYDRGYGWGILRWSNREFTDATMALCVLGNGMAALLCAILTVGEAGWLGILLGATPLAACMVLTDTVPREWCLFLLLLGLLLILLTQRIRSRDARQGNRLTALLLLPVSLALILLFAFVPRESYRGQELAQRLDALVQSWFEDPLAETDDPKTVLFPNPGGEDLDATTVRLGDVGPKDEQWSLIMKVKAQESGYIYLRGCTYNTYLGVSWTNTDAENLWPYETYEHNGQHFQVKISTHKQHGILYDTYVPVQQADRSNGRMENALGISEYTVDYLGPVTYDATWEDIDHGAVLVQQKTSQYLYLPQEASRWAASVLSGFAEHSGAPTKAADAWRLANKIVDYVRASAAYDLNTPQMPGNVTDFASWFMEESDTGYCVHFATAAAVLLREAGIPSRYVTGYLVQAVEGETVTVRAKEAHAWVECYIAGIGWIAMEPTPGASGTADPEPQRPGPVATRPQSTEPEQTETTEPAPTETTQTTTETAAAQANPEPPRNTGSSVFGRNTVVLTVLLWILGIAGLVLQWRLRVWLRYRKQHRGPANAQGLARWQEVERLTWLLEFPPEEVLLELAQKARFSRDTLTAEDLRQFDDWLAQARKQLRSRPVWYQLIYTLILAVY